MNPSTGAQTKLMRPAMVLASAMEWNANTITKNYHYATIYPCPSRDSREKGKENSGRTCKVIVLCPLYSLGHAESMLMPILQ